MQSCINVNRTSPRAMSHKKSSSKHRSGLAVASISSLQDQASSRSSDQESPNTCCGRFSVDFAKMCAERGLPYVPEVTARPWPPCKIESQSQKKTKEADSPTRNKKGEKRGPSGRKDSLSGVSGKKASVNSEYSAVHLQPVHQPTVKTYVSKENIQYAVPRVQVELEVADDDRTVTETHIREWRVDMRMMDALCQCWQAQSLLHTLHLWNTALDSPALALLSSCLPRCPRLTTLILDNNPLSGLPLRPLLAPDNHLQHLSLRWCGLDDNDVRYIALALEPTSGASPSDGVSYTGGSGLLTLYMADNRIGDDGAGFLAEALALNRRLLVLNLSSNRLTDAGAERLAEALSWFRLGEDLMARRRSLVHEQLERCLHVKKTSVRVMRYSFSTDNACPSKRQSKLLRGNANALGPGSSPGPGGASRISNPHSNEKLHQPISKKGDSIVAKDKEEKTSKDKEKKKTCTVQGKGHGKRKDTVHEEQGPCKLVLSIDPALTISRPLVKPDWHSESDIDLLSYGTSHALLQAGYLHQGQIWLPGNRTLLSLNLSRNAIGERGLAALLKAVKEQAIPCGEGRGLRRLVVGKNSAVSVGSPVAEALSRLMNLRDPCFRSPSINLAKGSISPCAIPVCY